LSCERSRQRAAGSYIEDDPGTHACQPGYVPGSSSIRISEPLNPGFNRSEIRSLEEVKQACYLSGEGNGPLEVVVTSLADFPYNFNAIESTTWILLDFFQATNSWFGKGQAGLSCELSRQRAAGSYIEDDPGTHACQPGYVPGSSSIRISERLNPVSGFNRPKFRILEEGM
jgi:hypothetical protein